MSDDFFERRVGSVLQGKWTLEKLLGVGGMAAVYVGHHHIGRRDAIKILHPSSSRSSEMRARFEQEARAVSRLGHPGVARIDDIDTAEDGSLFLVMELLDGESLGDRLERGGATPADALGWIDEILDVLEAAHALDIVHRDIKPDNVFLLRDGRVKLLDFGIARMRDAESLKTATGVSLGTLPYMAPEQVRGERVDARADLFAVGATLVRAIGRRPVHESNAEAELYLKMGTQPAPPARVLLPTAPESLWPVVDHALAFDRERRYASAKQMREDVQAVCAGRLPSHALAARRLEPTVVGVEPTVVGHPTLAATMRSTVADGRGVAATVAALPRSVLAVLAGSVLAGISLTALILMLVSDDEPEATADLAPPVAVAPTPAATASTPHAAGVPAAPGVHTPARQVMPPRRPPARQPTDEEQRKRDEKAREEQKKRDEKAREEQKKRDEKAREERKKRDEKDDD